MKLLAKNHLVSINQLSKNDILEIINLTNQLSEEPKPLALIGKVIAVCFFEPSTRTRLSFESAIYSLGGNIIGFSDDKSTSSGAKSESLEDSMKVIQNYANAIIIRHPQNHSAENVSKKSKIPIINAGDGSNEHPTQTLLDLFTIYDNFKELNNLNITFVGDLKYSRTVHSLLISLNLFDNITINLISPTTIKLPEKLLCSLNNLKINECHDLTDNIIKNSDVIYMTRLQKERFKNEKIADIPYILTADLLNKHAKKTLCVMHPLPRNQEISTCVDDTIFAKYFEQAGNGLKVRRAIIYELLLKGNINEK